MSASKVLDQAEQQGLLEPKVIDELRRQVAESKFVVTPEALAKVLVDRGHLTPFQARKLVATTLNEPMPGKEAPPPQAERPPTSKPAAPSRKSGTGGDELGLADEEPNLDQTVTAEDIVLMEAVDSGPGAAPSPESKSRGKPVFTPPKSGPSRSEKAAFPSAPGKPAKGPPPVPASDELIDLDAAPDPSKEARRPAAAPAPKPAAPAPPPKPSSSWKSPPPPPAPSEGLVPLSPVESARATAGAAAARPPKSPAPGFAPLTDLTADPFPADPLASAAKAQPAVTVGKRKKNVWDSPLLLIGGGALGLMIVFAGLLFVSLYWGNAAELFAKADEAYKNGAYSDAMTLYESYLESYPETPKASLAKVRLGMAELRQVSGDGQNPKQGLATAQRVLPEIKEEPAFDEARVELASILPDIADGFAKLATDAQTTAQKEQLVGQASEAMKLVNDSAYIPASLRKERETRIAEILDKLKVAERSIEQDKALVIALQGIGAAGQAGDAAGAYKIRSDLLKLYPALATHADLMAAIRSVGDRERELVKVSPETVPATTEDSLSSGARIVLAAREGPAPAAAPERVAFVQLEGAVYGIDAASGKTLWRRHVGYETRVGPQPVARQNLADAIVADARKHELLRLEAATGKLLWRQTIGQPFFSPTIADQRIFVTTGSGRIFQIDAASGSVTSTAQLPQLATVAAAFDSRQSRLIQLGQHSTVFVLSASTLECVETYYLGHLAGAVLVPPVTVLDHVVAFESPADDHTLLHILAPDEKSKRLSEIGKPLRLRGRVVMPPSVDRRTVAAMTDLGEIAVYEVNSTDKVQPVRLVAGEEPTERTPALGFYAAAGNRLWLAGRRCSMFEIQPAVQKLARKWSLYQDDAFVAPLVTSGDVLIHARRRPGVPGITVTGCDGASGNPLWESQLAAPIASLLPAGGGQAVAAVTSQGRVYSLGSEAGGNRVIDSPAFALPQGSIGSIWPGLAISPDGQWAAWAETQSGGRVFAFDVSSGSAPTSSSLPDGGTAAAPPVLWGKNLVVPLRSGQVCLVDLAAGRAAAQPFQPQLSPDSAPAWTQPAVLADESGFVIGDGRTMLYRVMLKAQPQAQLTAATEQATPLEVRGSLVSAGEALYGLGFSDAGQAVVSIDPLSLTLGSTRWQLAGQPLFGLTSLKGLAFIATEADGLLCFEGGQKLRWKVPLAHGPLAGPPLAGADGDLLLLYQSGFVGRANIQTGEELAAVDLGEPLGKAACVVGQQAYVSTSDGGVLSTPLPK